MMNTKKKLTDTWESKLLKKQYLWFGLLSSHQQVHNNEAWKLFDQQFSFHAGNEAGLAQLIPHSDKLSYRMDTEQDSCGISKNSIIE